MLKRISFLLLLCFGFAGVPALEAQVGVLPTRPFAAWRTVETDNFVIHYPNEMAEWTLPLVSRLEAVHTAVSNLVGHAPERRVTVVVMDPYNVSNAMALPFLDAPSIMLWPTPPNPRSGIGHHTGWGEILAIHEYGHIAHLTIPSRNPRQRLLWSLVPINLGPINRRSPRWVAEGYATYIEGKLTGSGRPHGVFRPAILRQWALEGRLPTYRQLSGSGDFMGRAMAYLVGSAFLEWLVEQRGEETLNHLWRRLSARQNRSFGAAFAGVYGGSPEELYGRFTVEVTRRALAAQQLLEREGLIEGETVQRREWFTGDPTLSPDGSRIAVVLPARDGTSRLVIWPAAEEPEDERAVQARERARRMDPEDVPAIDSRPRPRRALATLHPVEGRPHEAPRFLPDGRWVLVTRSEPLGDGTYRPDLFLWDWETGDLLRITRRAGIREADPSPAGRRAVGVRCLNGICDLVRVDLESGSVETIHHGLPDRVFYRPRYSPNGRQIVVAVQEEGRWRLALTGENGGEFAYVDPDDGASRYDATFLPDGQSLVTVSESGGVANLELLDLATGTVVPLTRVTSAAVAPEPSRADGSIYFLKLHGQGIDLNRIHPDSVHLESVITLRSNMSPVAPVPAAFAPDTFETVDLTRPRSYGRGPAQFRVLPGGSLAVEGNRLQGALVRTDPVGRLNWMLQGALGDPGTWRGAALNVAWRGFRPVLQGDLFWTRQHPSRQQLAWEGEEALAPLDVEYLGTTLLAEVAREYGVSRYRYRLGGSFGQLEGPAFDSDWRRFAFAEYQVGTRQISSRNRYFSQAIALHGAIGKTADTEWRRGMGTLSLGAGLRTYGVLAEITYGGVSQAATPFEHFIAGGARPELFDEAILAQRLSMPAFPLGIVAGPQIMAVRATASAGLLQPYFWAVSTDEIFEVWSRVVGIEQEFNFGAFPLGRLPRIQALAGVGYLLDEPYEGQFRAYLSVGYRP